MQGVMKSYLQICKEIWLSGVLPGKEIRMLYRRNPRFDHRFTVMIITWILTIFLSYWFSILMNNLPPSGTY
jgi:hypothetical protein